MILRDYQKAAVESVYRHLRNHDDNPVVVIPTGGGKTPVIATICGDVVDLWKGRVLVLSHVKELLEQTSSHLSDLVGADTVGLYSAGLSRRQTDQPITVAGIQSVYKRAGELWENDIVIVDECHLIPEKCNGMYRSLLAEMKSMNPELRVVGMTATPFRMKAGEICTPTHFLNQVCYEVGIKELIRQGYLCPVTCKGGKKRIDTSGLSVIGGEFARGEAEALMNDQAVVAAACSEIAERTKDRKATLIFCAGILHAQHVARVLQQEHGLEVGEVYGETHSILRSGILDDFKSGALKHVVNVNVLTTGFDAPNIDCVAMLRPTMSAGLYYQMVGRGFRMCEGKENCLILDYAGNVIRHGPVDQVEIRKKKKRGSQDAPAKQCPECDELIACGYKICPECGYEFPEPAVTHGGKAGSEEIISGKSETNAWPVMGISYPVHEKKGNSPDDPKTMRVEYRLGWSKYQSEWICVEHDGFAWGKAQEWWAKRSNAAFPDSAADAVTLAGAGAIAETKSISLTETSGERFGKIVGYVLGSKPAWREPGEDEADEEPTQEPWHPGEDECPF